MINFKVNGYLVCLTFLSFYAPIPSTFTYLLHCDIDGTFVVFSDIHHVRQVESALCLLFDLISLALRPQSDSHDWFRVDKRVIESEDSVLLHWLQNKIERALVLGMW